MQQREAESPTARPPRLSRGRGRGRTAAAPLAGIRALAVGSCLWWAAAAAAALAACAAGDDQARAAAEAAAYWRGGRVRASEEPNLPAPLITHNGSGPKPDIDYQGEPLVQECMEYYIDKQAAEPRLLREIRRRELEQQERAKAAGAKVVEEAPEVRGMVTYLLMENAERTIHKDLVLSLRSLGKFFPKYPVTVFHTNASTAAELALLRRSGERDGLEVRFEVVHLDFPPAVAGFPGGPDAFLAPPQCTMDGQHWWTTHRSCGCRCPAWRPQCWPLNWMHATRFFTAGMFRTQTFQRADFEYFLRMDTDLFFVASPEVDPFQLMESRGCAMVYDTLSREAPGCHDGFDEMTLAFFGHFGFAGRPDEDLLHAGHGPAAAGGQWTIGDARLFRSDRYLRFADYAAGGIYRHRWADQLFLVRGLALFGPRASGTTLRRSRRAGHEDAPPPTAICIRSLFADGVADVLPGGTPAGFVHLKGGFREPALVARCGGP